MLYSIEDGAVKWRAAPDVEFDVLTSYNQRLPEEALLREGDKVIYTIGLSGSSKLM